jgi:hypothetical protein
MDLDPHAVAPGGYNNISNAFDSFGGGGDSGTMQAPPPSSAPRHAAPPQPPAQQQQPSSHDAPFDATALPNSYRGFSPGKKSGPIENHRDGGGPDIDLDGLGL